MQYILVRHGGLGDVLMVCGAAKALKYMGHSTFISTDVKYQTLVERCPHESKSIQSPNTPIDLHPVSFGIAAEHQIDAYIRATGNDPSQIPPEYKTIDINFDRLPKHKNKTVAIHRKAVDRNRRYDRWDEVIELLTTNGISIKLVGESGLGLVGSMSEIERCHAFASCDSGPIQLAAPTSTPIVGIYTVTRGEWRLPFGKKSKAIWPECPSYPCYQRLSDPAVVEEQINSELKYGLTLAEAFGNMCPQGRMCDCLNAIEPSEIVNAIVGIML